jgi:hypothetical protein
MGRLFAGVGAGADVIATGGVDSGACVVEAVMRDYQYQ